MSKEMQMGPPLEWDVSPHPLFFEDILVEIGYHLSFSDLKSARRVNHLWWRACSPAWVKRAQFKFKDMHMLRDCLAKLSLGRTVLPRLIKNWTFEGESIIKLMNDDGLAERHQLEPYWRNMENIQFSNWYKTRFRYQYVRNPNNPNGRQIRQRLPYYEPTKMASSISVRSLLEICPNLKSLTIQYNLLTWMKGAYVGYGQFPRLEKLTSFKLYFEGKKYNRDYAVDPEGLLPTNIRTSDDQFGFPREVSGGNTLILRILDHSPNLVRIEVSSGSLLTTRIETWFLRHLLNWRVKLPVFQDFHSSVPLHEEIIRAFLLRPWPLKTLHLKTVPGEANAIKSSSLQDLLIHFNKTLQHLELILMRGGESAQNFVEGRNLPRVKSIELWGFTGDFAFLWEMRSLERAVIGALNEVEHQRIQSYFEAFPVPEHVTLELKSEADFLQRLDQGPRTPSTVNVEV